MMRDLIFNDASVAVPANSIHDVAPLLADIARGIAALVRSGCVAPALRARRPLYDIQCARDGNLFDAIQALSGRQMERDAKLFLLRLAQKTPLTLDLPSEIIDRFLGCESISPGAEDGQALMLCAHVGGIAVSIPLAGRWDGYLVTVKFLEIMDDGSFDEVSEKVDNLSCAAHARFILQRDRIGARNNLTKETFWESRLDVFPRLKFGIDVEECIRQLETKVFPGLMRRIDEIHSSALDWSTCGGAAPPWRCKVTPESAATMANETLRRARLFRDSRGNVRLYEWHARFGSAGRIHLRFDASTGEVEIGYVGAHLPLG